MTGSKSADNSAANLNLVGLDIAIASFPALSHKPLFVQATKSLEKPGNEAMFGTAT